MLRLDHDGLGRMPSTLANVTAPDPLEPICKMPELPEVETVRRGLEPAMVGARFIRVEQRRADLRFALPAQLPAKLTGRTVTGLGRRAKYLLADLDDGEVLVMHLGMTGRFIIENGETTREPGEFYQSAGRHLQHDHIVLHLSNGIVITYNDVRRFGFFDLLPRVSLSESSHFAGMGIEPLGNAFNGEVIGRLFKGRRAPLKAALLDQRLIAGLGNIYVCEALFRAGLSPERPAGSITPAESEKLASVIRAVLEEALEAGGSSLKDYVRTDGSLGYFQHRFQVYDREGQACPTPGCGRPIQRSVQSGRSTFYCVACQR